MPGHRDKEQRLPHSHHLLLGVAGAPAVRGSDAPAVRAGRARGANADAGIVEYGGRRLGWGVGGEERGVKKKGGQPKTNGDMCFFTFNVFFVLLELSFSEVFFVMYRYFVLLQCFFFFFMTPFGEILFVCVVFIQSL